MKMLEEVYKLKCTKCGSEMVFQDFYPLVQCQKVNEQPRIYIQENGVYECSNSECDNSYQLPYPQEPQAEWLF